jgi:ethanolaminephosphotransferase
MFAFFEEENLKAIKDHKYKSGQTSKIDQKLSEMLNPIVEYLPKYLTPNMITMIGFLIQVSSSFIMLGFMIKNKPIPGYMLVYSGLVLIIYNIMDFLDGKQARRLGMSSPLGQLMDHGLDCINSTFIILNLLLLTNSMGNSLRVFTFFMVLMVGFHLAQVEEYITHELSTVVLGIGVVEIQILVSVLFFTIYMIKKDFLEYKINKLSVFDLVMYLVGALLAVSFCLRNFYFFQKSIGTQIKYLYTIMPFMIISICAFVIFFIDKNSEYILYKFFILGIAYNIASIKMILSSISKKKLELIHFELIMICLYNLTLTLKTKQPIEEVYIHALFFVVFFSYSSIFYLTNSLAIANYLGINVFLPPNKRIESNQLINIKNIIM